MDLGCKLIRTSLRWCFSKLYPAPLLKFGKSNAIYWTSVGWVTEKYLTGLLAFLVYTPVTFGIGGEKVKQIYILS